MKRSITILPIILIFIIGCKRTFGQENFCPGYIITLSGDTVKGFINYRNWDRNPERIDFRKEVHEKTMKYGPLDISQFNTEGHTFVSSIVTVDSSPHSNEFLTDDKRFHYRTDTAFILVLAEGEKSLYRYKDRRGEEHFLIREDSGYVLLHYKRYYDYVGYLSDNDAQKIITSNNKYIGQLTYYLRDCPDIRYKISRTKYSRPSLMKLFEDYYHETNETYIEDKEEKKFSFAFGAFTGYAATKLSFYGVEHDILVEPEKPISYGIPLGCRFDINFLSRLKKFCFSTEILYTGYDIQFAYNEDRNFSYDVSFVFKYLKLNTMVRFLQPVGDVDLYVNAGLSNGLVLSHSEQVKVIRNGDPSVIVSVEDPLEPRLYEQGYLAGIGALYKKFFIEFRYERSGGMSQEIFLDSPIDRVYFLVGLKI